MRFVATILVLVPGVFALVSDPDAMGIGFLVLLLVPLYVAWRTKIVGGIILIGVGAVLLGFFFKNLISPVGIPGGITGILQWVALAILPAAAGIGRVGIFNEPKQATRIILLKGFLHQQNLKPDQTYSTSATFRNVWSEARNVRIHVRAEDAFLTLENGDQLIPWIAARLSIPRPLL